MPSSTSSSERDASGLMRLGMPGDDPGAALGPLLRPLPTRALRVAAWIGLVLTLVGLAGWEGYWRDFGVTPGYRNSDGLWAMQRRRINAGEGDRTVLVGASRVLFDIDLDTWERVTGERPIQLAIEGTTPLPILEDLAADQDFTGRVLVGVAPDVYFSNFAYRGDVLDFWRDETPSQRASQWLSMRMLEPWLAFFNDPDFALFTVLERQPWPVRTGVPHFIEVRKLAEHSADRNTRMWEKVENDPEYRALSRQVWAQFFDVPIPGFETPELRQAAAEKEIVRSVAVVEKLRARGIPVAFVRPPSDADYHRFEERDFPRVSTWDPLIARTGMPGVNFEDHASMQGLTLPEWSHLSAADAKRFTEALLGILQREARWSAPIPVRTTDEPT